MDTVPTKPDSFTSRASWLTFAKTVGFVFTMALPLILARRMIPEQVGLYKQAFLIVTSAMTVLPLGVHMSAYYFLPREPGMRRQVVLNIMLILMGAGLLGCSLLAFYPKILVTIFSQPELAQYSHLIGLTLLLWIVGMFLESIPIANEEIQLATLLIISTNATRAIVFLTAATMWGTVRSLLYAAIIHGSVQTVTLFCYLQSRFPGFWHSFDWLILRRQISYAIPLGTAATMFTLQNDLHNYFVSRRFPPAIFAIYSFGTLQLPLMGLIGEAVNAVLMTRISVLQQQDDNHEIILLVARAARKLAVVYFSMYAALLVMGPEIIRVLFTSRYAGSWPIFAVNLTMLPLNILLLDPIVRAFASERLFFLRLRLVMILLQVIVLSLWTRQLGLVGIITVVTSINIMERAIGTFYLSELLGVSRKDILLLGDIAKLALAALIAAAVCAALRLLLIGSTPFVILTLCGTAFAIVYVSSICVLRIPTGDEYDYIREAIVRYLPPYLRCRLN